jgi:hypothetical protein
VKTFLWQHKLDGRYDTSPLSKACTLTRPSNTEEISPSKNTGNDTLVHLEVSLTSLMPMKEAAKVFDDL